MPAAVFDNAGQVAVAARLGAAPTYLLFSVTFAGRVEFKVPNGAAALELTVGVGPAASRIRLGVFNRSRSAHEAAKLQVAQAVLERASWFVATVFLQARAPALEPLPPFKKKRKMNAQDDLVKECMARMKENGTAWEDDSVDVIAYLKESHGGFFYSTTGQSFVELLKREWRERNPPFQAFEALV